MSLRVLFGSIVVLVATGGSARADSVRDLVEAIEAFRGIGAVDLSTYRVTLRIPEEGEEELAPLEETWQSPARLALRAAEPGTPVAIVRGLALFLEPLYVTRTSLFSVDLESGVESARSEMEVVERETEDGRVIDVRFPESPADDTPDLLRDLASLTGTLDPENRLVALRIEIRDGLERQLMSMRCRWARGEPQPHLATWTLPNRDRVEIVTTFRSQGGRTVPAARHVTFPSRYDPGESEEVFVEYADYTFDPVIEEEFWTAHGTFRFDANGLVTD